jgi:hypothetical protein
VPCIILCQNLFDEKQLAYLGAATKPGNMAPNRWASTQVMLATTQKQLVALADTCYTLGKPCPIAGRFNEVQELYSIVKPCTSAFGWLASPPDVQASDAPCGLTSCVLTSILLLHSQS